METEEGGDGFRAGFLGVSSFGAQSHQAGLGREEERRERGVQDRVLGGPALSRV